LGDLGESDTDEVLEEDEDLEALAFLIALALG